MSSSLARLVFLPVLPFSTMAMAAPDDADLGRDARAARLTARVARTASRNFSFEANLPVEPEAKLTIGAAYDRDHDNGRNATTPFTLSYDAAAWGYIVQGDAFTRQHPVGKPVARGFADVTTEVSYKFSKHFEGYAGIDLPTGGGVGSTAATQRAKLSYSRPIGGPWSSLFVGSVSHANEADSDAGKYAETVRGEVSYEIGNDERRIVLLGVTHGHRAGVPLFTELAPEVDFPVYRRIDGSFIITRGVSRGSRHTGVELDFTFSF